MGQGQSREGQPVQFIAPEILSSQLAHRFAERCFTPLELTHFKDVFRTLADAQDGLQHWREETLCRFLAVPDALEAGPVLFQMATYLGAFPCPSLAPVPVTREALVKVVVIMTERYGRVLRKGLRDRNKLLFRSLAIFDRKLPAEPEKPPPPPDPDTLKEKDITDSSALNTPYTPAKGFAVDAPGREDDDYDDDDDDELALAALDSLDSIEVYKTEAKPPVSSSQARIPIDNWRRLLLFLLVIAPLDAQESLAALAADFSPTRLAALGDVADSLLAAFAPDAAAGQGVTYARFSRALTHVAPNLFAGLGPLFEHFLFSRNLDLSRHRPIDPSSTAAATAEKPAPASEAAPPTHGPGPAHEPLLPAPGEILDAARLAQLATFLPGGELFRRLRPLYQGAEAGFSINALAQKVLNWKAPSVLLVAGTRLPADPADAPARAFLATLPPRARLPPATEGGAGARVVFGAWLATPWRTTHREATGEESTVLFQLAPAHDVFRASRLNRDYLTFNSAGLGLGAPPSRGGAGAGAGAGVGAAGAPAPLALGPVSLVLDAGLEFGAFAHDGAPGGGGAFAASRVRAPGTAFIERFAVDAVEVWGCGGDAEAERQRAAWAWEEREAAKRRGLNIGRDKEADYALLEMAGLVGGHGNSGGSMG